MREQRIEAIHQLIEAEAFGCRVVAVAGPAAFGDAVLGGAGEVVAGGIPSEIESAVVADARSLMAIEQTTTLRYGDHEVFFEVIAPRPQLLIFGAVHIAQVMVPMAAMLGFSVTVSDARQAFITEERFPTADELLVGWPGDLGDALRFDARTFVVVLSHDARYEDPLWPVLLPSPVRYIGAMGSRKTAGARRQRLTVAGYAADQIERIHGPVGLDIGAQSPAEIAVAILGEMTSVRYGVGSEPQLNGSPVRLAKSEHL